MSEPEARLVFTACSRFTNSIDYHHSHLPKDCFIIFLRVLSLAPVNTVFWSFQFQPLELFPYFSRLHSPEIVFPKSGFPFAVSRAKLSFVLHPLILGLYTLTVVFLPINMLVLKHFQNKIRVNEGPSKLLWWASLIHLSPPLRQWTFTFLCWALRWEKAQKG